MSYEYAVKIIEHPEAEDWLKDKALIVESNLSYIRHALYDLKEAVNANTDSEDFVVTGNEFLEFIGKADQEAKDYFGSLTRELEKSSDLSKIKLAVYIEAP